MKNAVRAVLPPPRSGVRFKATDLSGEMRVEERFDRELTAADLTQTLVKRMGLPREEYYLQNDTSGQTLKEQVVIGTQIAEDDEITVTPSPHLG